MTRFLILVFIVAAAAGFFLYTQQAEAPTQPASSSDSMMGETPENVFGEGADIVGDLDPGSGPVPEGTEPPVAPNEEETAAGITRAELARHASQADCWIAYKGVVYDITNWLPRHPGSAAAIAPYCGTAEEFAAAFNRQHGTGKDARLQREGVEKGTLTQ